VTSKTRNPQLSSVSTAAARSSAEFFALARLAAIPLKALVAFTARCARRVQPLWGDLDPSDRSQLERAIAIAERVGAGRYTHLDARQAEGVDIRRWSSKRPDFGTARTASGTAIYALVCACCETSQGAATPALLAVREAHFAAGGDSRDLKEAEKHFHTADQAPPGSTLSLVATGIRRDLERVAGITDRGPDDSAIRPEFFGPLWPSGAPSGWPDE
jgi:hypothetical protein